MSKGKLILGEIAWCKVHRGDSAKGDVWEDGFIEGLKQALRLMRSRPIQRPTPRVAYAKRYRMRNPYSS